ncbi:hypothetical protein, partial [Hominenteromicrobium sp.]|uniref:hypothetical protein n=2 Tax=Hominenteromicrobium sp. TaxID=3073581 RepID=UPI003AB604A8
VIFIAPVFELICTFKKAGRGRIHQAIQRIAPYKWIALVSVHRACTEHIESDSEAKCVVIDPNHIAHRPFVRESALLSPV